jgi:biotin-dependent carboxylase-like uncharacterized protein
MTDPTLRVLQTGVLATIQDRGRLGAQRWGVPVGGAMDPFALAVANELVNNAPDAAVLEITAGGAAFEILRSSLLAITGGLTATLNDEPVPWWTSIWTRAGAEFRIEARSRAWGARAYVAVAGGVDVPIMLGAHSTCLPGAFGGLSGRPLRAGDLLHAEPSTVEAIHGGRSWPADARPRYRASPTLRVLPGPYAHLFASGALDLLQGTTWTIGTSSNRTGYRLDGAQLQAHGTNLPSLPVFAGVVQVPPDGAPIVLMADAQPTGGYPIVAVVIAPDLPLAAQLLPGDTLRFTLIDQDAARAACYEMHTWLRSDPVDDEMVEVLGWAGA